jgi:hypothetical protein
MSKEIEAEVQEEISSDGDTKLGFWYARSFETQAFGLVMSDEEGYNSLWVSLEAWEMIKSRVDAMIQLHITGTGNAPKPH